MTRGVVEQKVRRPEPDGLSRPRLEQRLIGTRHAGIALVVAPPGSGKTTLLAQVAALSGGLSAWYCVGPEDGSELAFVRHLAHALASVTPAVDPAIESVDELLIALQGEVHPLLLVVDDLHEVSGSTAEVALERFVRLRPRSVTVLLGSRRTPAINTTRLLASGELVELGVDDLRFRSWEVEELYRCVYEEPLSPESAAALTRRTEGWAAGLQLFHLSTVGQERSVRESAVADLSGRSRLIRSYLTHNVISDLPPDRRDFLVTTSTLGVLSGSVCNELLCVTGSLAVLQDLESHHFFTTSTDDGQTFRYHEILRSHLEVLLLDRSGESAALELYARAATILEAHGFGQAALRAYARAREWSAVARLVRISRSCLSVDEVLSAPGCPSTARSWDDPWMALSDARRLVRHGELGAALQAYDRARELADDDAVQRESTREQERVRLWLPPTTDEALHRVTDLRLKPAGADRSIADAPVTAGQDRCAEPSTASLVRQATVAILPGAAASASTVLGAAVVHLLAGQLEQARQLVDRSSGSTGSGSAGGWEETALRLLRLVFSVVDDTVVDPNRSLEELCLTADLEGYAWLARVGRGVQSWVLAPGAGGSVPGAPDDAPTTGRRDQDPWGVIVLGLVAGIMLLRRDRASEVRVVMRSVSDAAAQVGAPVLGLWASVLDLEASAAAPRQGEGFAFRTTEADRLRTLAAQLGVVGVDGGCLRLGGIRRRVSSSTRARPELGSALVGAGAGARGGAGQAVPDYGQLATVLLGSGIELRCLGGLSLRTGSGPVDVGLLRPRARTLLRVLSVRHGHDVHREELIDLLWPGTSVELGAHRLHVAASSVRRLLAVAGCAPDPLRRNDDAYRLELNGVHSDVAHFEDNAKDMGRAIAQREPAAALAHGLASLGLYTGPLLPEVGPAEWVVGERERLRVLATSVAIDVARLAQQLDRLEDGLQAAQRAVEIDPLRDAGWKLLAEHQDALGERAAATTTRREHQRLLTILEASS